MFGGRGLRYVFLLASLVVLVVTGCSAFGSRPPDITHVDFSQTGDGKLKVMTTVSPLTNIALSIGGTRIALYGLIPDGVDSHTFEPKPSDAKTMTNADLVIINGAHLEGNTKKMAETNLKKGATVYEMAANTLSGDDPATGFLYDFSFPKEAGDPNPHLWMNPKYSGKYADLMTQWFSAADPKNADYYKANNARFQARIADLDQRIRKAVATIPAKNRKLLTYHDAYAYFAREYGMEVIGAIQPSDFSQPSAQEVAKLIDQIKQVGVPAVFGSEVYPSKVSEQIAKEAHATYVDKMRDDEPPGDANSPQHTYLGMMLEDMKVMTAALGGDASVFDGFDPTNTYQQ
ncbi:MAG: zinc ABC transporter substrate-binding protein [Dehalococcoidia bacterium]|nr:zinc ABC transporter substrate-binding protein [Dehalococcoidia bacterium]